MTSSETVPTPPAVPSAPALEAANPQGAFARFQASRYRRMLLLLSAVMVAVSLLGFLVNGRDPQIGAPLRAGLDFRGGTSIQLELACHDPGPCAASERLQLPAVRSVLADLQWSPAEDRQPAPAPSSFSLQLLDNGEGLLLRSTALTVAQAQAIEEQLATAESIAPLQRERTQVDTIGPSLGAQLLQSALLALTAAFAGVAVYIAIRFSPINAVLALGALVHDVVIVAGLFAWLGQLLDVEVGSLFAVALLTLAGYSVNDTVVVFDRIRETDRLQPHLGIIARIDRSIAASLVRSLNTSITTELPILALALFSGGELRWFAVALAFGIGVGTYSSLFVAPLLLGLLKKDTAPSRS
ncbi:MAG: protein translocase subunit SecF [Synechococcus sp. SB0673_bin_10]|nr:protein translocase subunit SecF [Cyanobacteria bacterium MAG IRC3_bin_20]MDE0647395.1 protein translocase subunit SecF [Cyanobacteria bacterium MAG IRC4_bin_6]MXX09484.1 protein translocase subunit SecF [Synechococcus sp. SB0667_bin_8]MXY18743.1 protein translocase subunit SecF [Synechococcus sp. SB0664_bin_36]MYF20794.1 protein translocase subunit SecF [Synechococcus sp. SB0677_bin_5]MYI71362.1 protein translocase subunit SecF [Synechococcus sp. SB0673_bin_10]MYK07708.1 protein transloca